MSTGGTSMDTGEAIGACAPFARGIQFSPELRTASAAPWPSRSLSTLGRIVVPVAVQQTLDRASAPRAARTSGSWAGWRRSPRSPSW